MEFSKVTDLIIQFKDYLQSDEAKGHLLSMKKEKEEVRKLMTELSKLDQNSPQFTELVLYGLLPYKKTKFAKRISLFPVFLNIKPFFSQYKYTDDDWKIIAKKIFELCMNFDKYPEKLEELIDLFTKDKYSKSFQSGTISPILFALNDNFPVINWRVIRSYNSINKLIGNHDKLTRELSEYPVMINKLSDFVEKSQTELLKTNDQLDLFFYWYDTHKNNDVDDEEKKHELVKEEQKISEETINYQNLLNLDYSFVPSRITNPDKITIKELLNAVEHNKWVIPHFQRYFDWNENDICELWKAIIKGYFVGSFLVWKVEGTQQVGIQSITGVQKTDIDLHEIDYIILDGQQRITSLYYAVNSSKIKVNSNNQIIKDTSIPLYFYINFYSFYKSDNNNQIVEVSSKEYPKEVQLEKLLFPLFELDTYAQWENDLFDFLYEKTNSLDFARKLSRDVGNRLNHLLTGFEIPYIILPKSIGLEQVSEIFEGINTKGKRLNVFDLLIARLYVNKIQLRDIWDKTLEKYPRINVYFSEIDKIPVYILQAISLLYEKGSSAKRSEILNIYENIYKNTDRDFLVDWEETASYLDKAIQRLEDLKGGFGVKSVKEIPYASMIPVLTALLRVIHDLPNKVDCYTKLTQWFWSAIFTYAYNSAADSQMTKDFKEVKEYFQHSESLPEVISQMYELIPTLSITNIYSASNARYRGIMALIALEGSCDFNTNQTLANAPKNDKDHLFPASLRKEFGGKIIDSVINMTWMSDETNKHIKSAKRPSEYIPYFIEKQFNNDTDAFINLLKTHLIDEKAYSYMIEDNYEEFLVAREKKVISKLKTLVGYNDTITDVGIIHPNNPFDNKMLYLNMLSSSDSYIYWLDKYFNIEGLNYLKLSIEKNNISQIRILLSSDKATEGLRSFFKAFKDQYKNIDSSMRVIVDSKVKESFHDRFLISKFKAYVIPSPDIIARGQLSQISESFNRNQLLEEFDKLWSNALDIITQSDLIKNPQK